VEQVEDVDWYAYFKSIRDRCPWSYAAYLKGDIDIVTYQGNVLPLGNYQARMYVIHAPNATVEALAYALDEGKDEWLFSYPGYGANATPVSVLIQQNRQRLTELREKLDASP
jgi:hypothetical protein